MWRINVEIGPLWAGKINDTVLYIVFLHDTCAALGALHVWSSSLYHTNGAGFFLCLSSASLYCCHLWGISQCLPLSNIWENTFWGQSELKEMVAVAKWDNFFFFNNPLLLKHPERKWQSSISLLQGLSDLLVCLSTGLGRTMISRSVCLPLQSLHLSKHNITAI